MRVSDYADSLGVDREQFSLKNPKTDAKKKPMKISRDPPPITTNNNEAIGNAKKADLEGYKTKCAELESLRTTNNEILIFDAVLELLANPKFKVLISEEKAKELSQLLKRLGFSELSSVVDKEFVLRQF
jgi:hypothetical protein